MERRNRFDWRRAIIPTLAVGAISITTVPEGANLQNSNLQITEHTAELLPIEINTIAMQPGKIYELPRWSIVTTTSGELIADGKSLSRTNKPEDIKAGILFTITEKESVVTATGGAKAQVNIDPTIFKTVVANEVVQMDKETNYNLIVRDQKGWPLWRKIATIGIPIGLLILLGQGNNYENSNYSPTPRKQPILPPAQNTQSTSFNKIT